MFTFTTISIVITLTLVVSGIYLFPVSRAPFNKLYVAVPEEIRRSLQSFRSQHALRQVRVSGVDWHYISVGDSEPPFCFFTAWEAVMISGGRLYDGASPNS
ncbi:MAG: hypothetical protein ACQ9MH_20835 [Nitrospinales bacterium]